MALCAGVGGLELGLRLAIGPDYRTVVFCEREAFAAAILVARMAEAIVHPAPIWDDVSTFEGAPWRGIVDIVTSGFPCQPWSLAGKRAGVADARWLWPDIARIIRDVRPRYVFLENVPALVRGGLEYVIRDLAECGFAAEWDCFSAAEVGAPHRRERLFILADAGCERGDWLQPDGFPECEAAAIAGENGADVADPERQGLALGQCVGCDDGAECAAAERAGDALWPPGPGERDGWPAGLEPAIRGVAHGVPYRLDRLHALGNGVVPLVAATAFRTLWRRLMSVTVPVL